MVYLNIHLLWWLLLLDLSDNHVFRGSNKDSPYTQFGSTSLDFLVTSDLKNRGTD